VTTGVTLDAGALIAIERGSRRMQALLERIANRRLAIAVPAAALGQVWRASPRQARLTRLLNTAAVEVVSLDDLAARAAGVLCGKAGTSDVVDASVVLCARERGHSVVTSDIDDLARLDPTLRLLQP
jgi:predicted nucleic acid-binding protein